MNKIPKTITVYGAGYVGLVTAVCFAELGNHVLVIDINAQKIHSLLQGICTFYEPGLEQSLQRQLAAGRLSFSTEINAGVAFGFFQFIAVGTPAAQDGSADLSQVLAVTQALGENISEYRLVVNKSTAPLGTVKRIQEKIQEIIAQRQVEVEFDVISNPEFLAQGAAIHEFMNPDRIIAGVNNSRAADYIRELYVPLDPKGERFILMDPQSAELTKYAANVYLASRISFMNELSQMAEYYDADIDLIRQGIGSDHRIGPHFLYAGCGFGGSCFPKDVSALRRMAGEINCSMPLLDAVEVTNQRQKQLLFKKISHYFDDNLTGKVIAIWGLSFKPNTDDMREAPSRVLIDALIAKGALVQAYDPAAAGIAEEIYQNNRQVRILPSANATLEQADVLALVTDWQEFRHPDLSLIKQKLRFPAVFDGRNLYDPKAMTEHGLKYFAVGRGDRANAFKS